MLYNHMKVLKEECRMKKLKHLRNEDMKYILSYMTLESARFKF